MTITGEVYGTKEMGRHSGRAYQTLEERSEGESGCWFSHRVPPHWYRNHLNRRERRRSKQAMFRGREAGYPDVHPREAGWYW